MSRIGFQSIMLVQILGLLILSGCRPDEPSPCPSAWGCVQVSLVSSPECTLINGARVAMWKVTKTLPEPKRTISVSLDEHGFHPNSTGGIDETHVPVIRVVEWGKWENLRCAKQQDIITGAIHEYVYAIEKACYIDACTLTESDETGQLPNIPTPPTFGTCEAMCERGDPNCIKHVIDETDQMGVDLGSAISGLIEQLVQSPHPQNIDMANFERLMITTSGQDCDRNDLRVFRNGRAFYSGNQCRLWFPAHLENVDNGWDIEGFWLDFPSFVDGNFSRVQSVSGRWTLPDTGTTAAIRWQLSNNDKEKKEMQEFVKWIDFSIDKSSKYGKLTFTGTQGFCIQIS